MPGPAIRTDIVDVYVFRLVGKPHVRTIEVLQLHRAQGALSDTWQPVMGHVKDGETAVDTALRELHEETSYTSTHGLKKMWQLESVNTYFLAGKNCVMMSPCFATWVDETVEPTLDAEHDAHRWVARDHVDRVFMWPGQRIAIEQLVRDIVPAAVGGTSLPAPHLEIPLPKP